jgi:hypothetical protein
MIIYIFVHASKSEGTHVEDHYIYIYIYINRCSLFSERPMSIIVIMGLDIDSVWVIGD